MTSLPPMEKVTKGGRAQTERELPSVVVRVELCVLWGDQSPQFPQKVQVKTGKVLGKSPGYAGAGLGLGDFQCVTRVLAVPALHAI